MKYLPKLTSRLALSALIAGGLSNSEVGRKLFIAPSTVKKHLENVYGKLAVRNRTEAERHTQGTPGTPVQMTVRREGGAEQTLLLTRAD